MSEELETLKSEYLDAARAAASLAALDEVRVRALGKKGAVTQRTRQFLQHVFPCAGQANLGALGVKTFRNGATDAACGTCDQCAFSR